MIIPTVASCVYKCEGRTLLDTFTPRTRWEIKEDALPLSPLCLPCQSAATSSALPTCSDCPFLCQFCQMTNCNIPLIQYGIAVNECECITIYIPICIWIWNYHKDICTERTASNYQKSEVRVSTDTLRGLIIRFRKAEKKHWRSFCQGVKLELKICNLQVV